MNGGSGLPRSTAVAPGPESDPARDSTLRSYSIVKAPVVSSTLDWTHFGFAMFKPSLNRLLTRAAQNVVTGTQARRPVLRGDLNLKEVGKGRATRLVTFSPLKLWPKSTSTATVREIWPQLASQAASLPRGAGSQYHAGGPKPA